MPQILVVCTGNTCRSPVVEGLLRNRLSQSNQTSNWIVDSAGTQATNGQKPTPEGVLALKQLEGIDISDGLAARLTTDHIQQADLIICMAKAHAEFVHNLDQQARYKTYLLTDFVDEVDGDIPDPIGHPLETYLEMVKTVSKCIDKGLPTLVRTVVRD